MKNHLADVLQMLPLSNCFYIFEVHVLRNKREKRKSSDENSNCLNSIVFKCSWGGVGKL